MPHSLTRVRNRRLTLSAAALLASFSLALSGCSSSGGLSGGFSATEAVNSTPATAELDGFYVFSAADVVGMQQALGYQDDEMWLEYLSMGRDANDEAIPLAIQAPDHWGFDEQMMLPWKLDDVEQFAQFAATPASITLYDGTDDIAIPDDFLPWEGAIKTDDDRADFASDLARVGDMIDPLGRPTRMAEQNGTVAMGPSTELISAWLAGKNALGSTPAVAQVAAALDKHQVLSVMIMSAAPEFTEPALVSEPFDTVGFGWAMRDDEPRWLVVYRFASANVASAALASVTEAWENETTSDAAPRYLESNIDGTTVTVVLEPRDGQSGKLLQRYAFDPRGLLSSPR